MQSADPDRPNGIVMYNCPEGDVTGDDLEACTVWQGLIYGVSAAGQVDNLLPEWRARRTDPAAGFRSGGAQFFHLGARRRSRPGTS